MHLILFALIVGFLIRLITRPFRRHRWHRRGFGQGWGGGFNNGGFNNYGGLNNGYNFNRPGAGLFTILAIVALERLFGGRRY